jgi:hypothetical protein
MLPQNALLVETSTGTHTPLLIGDSVPESLTVNELSGQKRTLLSYKAAVDILVVGFFSTHCDMNKLAWPLLRRLNDSYKDWRVSFIAVSSLPNQTLPELSQVLNQNHLSWPVVQDNDRTMTRRLSIAYTPEIVILDEFGALRYRGPVTEAGKALDAMIGHIDPVADPEPAMTNGCPLP